MSSNEAPRVFISYSHDSLQHSNKVLTLADRLRKEGVDAIIDQYVENPPSGWYRWMEDQVELADYVLVVCTEPYLTRFRGHESPHRGLGATWEGAIITAELYHQGANNEKYVPLVMSTEDGNFIPSVLQAATHYDLSRSDEYDRLYRRLTGQPAIEKPAIGNLVKLPAQERALGYDHIQPVAPSSSYITRRDLFNEIGRLLDENGMIFESFGPESEAARRNPLTDAVHIWQLRKRDTIIPNNSQIVQLMRLNDSLLTSQERSVFLRFQSHSRAFEDNVDGTMGGDVVPRFPKEFRHMVNEGRKKEPKDHEG